MNLALVILSFLLPPVAVAAKRGVSPELLINCLLTLFGFWILGVIHALLVICTD